MSETHDYGIVPPTGAKGEEWFKNFVLQQGKHGSLSSAGWTIGNEGFPQQTFLGASIRSFSMNAGFGGSSSTLSVELVDDEYNKSDGNGYGVGDDAYHNGQNDLFRPPAVGSPVFFKFGKNPATVEQAWRKTYDQTYGQNTLNVKPFKETDEDRDENFKLERYHYVDLEKSTENTYRVVDKSPLWDLETDWRGSDHIVFGGILQGYTENQGAQGKGLFTANIIDPREILSNCSVILSNYQGTTFNNKNLFNVYGFLEYDPSQGLQGYLNSVGSINLLRKHVYQDGTVAYLGDDTYAIRGGNDFTSNMPSPGTNGNLPKYWPVTGQGLSRRSDQGIPFYRVSQALATMFEYYGFMPEEFVSAGFGGKINYRGFNYVVDFTGIPVEKIPSMYFMDFDQIDLLSLAQELCDIISHELFVQLLPIIDHPACEFLEDYNKEKVKQGKFNEIVAGIIRIDAIDKSKQPRYGAILEYLNEVRENGVDVLNQDVGFELSNVTTDKFVVGAQEVEMYFFHTNNDRDELFVNTGKAGAINTLKSEQWLMETALKQQALPYYGLIGDRAVTIPKGWGSYQQILLDATSLNAFGVGNYYIATELELRAALVSFERWKSFLLKYNEVYIQDIEEYQATLSALGELGNGEVNDALDPLISEGLEGTEVGEEILKQFQNRQFAVTVPRCVWDSDRPYMGYDGLPASPCSPPFGYPLYYKRATKIGIPEAGVAKIISGKTKVITNMQRINDRQDDQTSAAAAPIDSINRRIDALKDDLEKIREDARLAHPDDKNYQKALSENGSYQTKLEALKKAVSMQDELVQLRDNLRKEGKELLADTKNALEGFEEDPFIQSLPQIAKAHVENAKKVYQFVRKIAEESLGKKFLVKIPKACNVRYQPNVKTYGSRGAHIAAGPFGFPPRPVDENYSDPSFQSSVNAVKDQVSSRDWFLHYTNIDIVDFAGRPLTRAKYTNFDGGVYRNGALRANYNPINDKWNFNYKPETQGGYFNYPMFQTSTASLAGTEALCPIDIQNFISENGRVSCYVKYDNSHLLNFANVGKSDIAQQSISLANRAWSPDITQTLPNIKADQLNLFKYDTLQGELNENAKNFKQSPSVAFVKCQVEEKFFMPPKMHERDVLIYARKYKAYLTGIDYEFKEEADENNCPSYSLKLNRIDPIFGVGDNGGSDGAKASYLGFVRNEIPFFGNPRYKEYIINTETQNLDSNHVYALVTVPGRVQSTIDQRYVDGPMRSNNVVTMSQLMTLDVVDLPEFSVPALPVCEFKEITCGEDELENFSPSLKELNEVQRIERQAFQGAKFALGEVGLEFTQPSPVMPNMFAIPLLSWERCYGPWLSSSSMNQTRKRYSNLGGKVEFIKDENLAPWNYGGYQLLNEAGSLQAEFSNSLMLINERGGFVVPEIPTGISLAKALKESGPLVTSISSSVTSNSIETTVKLDLYTAAYGKLQKQKEGAIAQITRERQKIKDQNNNAIRRGVGKSQTAIDPVGSVFANGGQKILDIVKGQEMFLEKEQEAPQERLLIASDTQTRIGTERRIAQGIEQYNTLAQQAQAFGWDVPVVPMERVFEVVNDVMAGGPLASKDKITEYTTDSIRNRYYTNPNEGEFE